MGERYDGPRCYVCRDEYAERAPRIPGLKPRIVKIWEGGWHYSIKTVTEKITRRDPLTGIKATTIVEHSLPDRKLHLNDTAANEADWFYELADATHSSWLEKHGTGNIVHLEELPAGEQHPPAAHVDHPEHGDFHAFHGSQPGKVGPR